MHKVLLDENLPVKIKHRLKDVCDVFTIYDKGWNSLENGALIKAMEDDGFEYLITSDKNLQYQQNFENYKISFIVLNINSNTYEAVLPLVDKLREVLIQGTKIKLMMIDLE